MKKIDNKTFFYVLIGVVVIGLVLAYPYISGTGEFVKGGFTPAVPSTPAGTPQPLGAIGQVEIKQAPLPPETLPVFPCLDCDNYGNAFITNDLIVPGTIFANEVVADGFLTVDGGVESNTYLRTSGYVWAYNGIFSEGDIQANGNLIAGGDLTVSDDATVLGDMYLVKTDACSGKLYTDANGKILCGSDQAGGVTCPDCDSRFVNAGGDTITGNLNVNGILWTNIINSDDMTAYDLYSKHAHITYELHAGELCIDGSCRTDWPEYAAGSVVCDETGNVISTYGPVHAAQCTPYQVSVQCNEGFIISGGCESHQTGVDIMSFGPGVYESGWDDLPQIVQWYCSYGQAIEKEVSIQCMR